VRLREQGLLLDKGHVGGKWIDADSGETFEVVDPATGEVLANVPRMGVAETRRAIEAAAEAYPEWRSLLARERAQILRRWADSLLEHVDDRARINVVRQEAFGEARPASTLVEIAALAIPGARIEVEAVAVVP